MDAITCTARHMDVITCTARHICPVSKHASVHPLLHTTTCTLQASSAHNESFGRAGVLQQAIIMEVPTAAFNAIELSVEGYDGQLPKLDMYWLLKYYSSAWTGLPVLLRGQLQASRLADTFKDTPALQQHVYGLANLAQFVWRQARGLPLGAHAAFKVYNVDAITVRLVHEVRPWCGCGCAGSCCCCQQQGACIGHWHPNPMQAR
jgi:hypothetical protein